MFICECGIDIFCSKGILKIFGDDWCYVFQGVYMVMDFEWGVIWEMFVFISWFVFIGCNFNEVEFSEVFLGCVMVWEVV